MKPTAIWPVAMTVLNGTLLVAGFVFEGRFRVRKAQFTLLYAGTIPPAMRGDLEPFFRVLAM